VTLSTGMSKKAVESITFESISKAICCLEATQ
jgi:hypothetical protein